jgi:hypothetical protein
MTPATLSPETEIKVPAAEAAQAGGYAAFQKDAIETAEIIEARQQTEIVQCCSASERRHCPGPGAAGSAHGT